MTLLPVLALPTPAGPRNALSRRREAFTRGKRSRSQLSDGLTSRPGQCGEHAPCVFVYRFGHLANAQRVHTGRSGMSGHSGMRLVHPTPMGRLQMPDATDHACIPLAFHRVAYLCPLARGVVAQSVGVSYGAAEIVGRTRRCSMVTR